MRKKLLSFVLALAMVLSLTPVHVFAESSDFSSVTMEYKDGQNQIKVTTSGTYRAGNVTYLVVNTEHAKDDLAFSSFTGPSSVDESFAPITGEYSESTSWEQSKDYYIPVTGMVTNDSYDGDLENGSVSVYLWSAYDTMSVIANAKSGTATITNGQAPAAPQNITSPIVVSIPDSPKIGDTVADSSKTVISSTEGVDSVSSVSWSGASGDKWADGETPKLTFTLNADTASGYQFPALATDGFTVSGATVSAGSCASGATSVTVTVDYTELAYSEIASVTLSGVPNQPAVGAAMEDPTVTTSTDGVTVASAAWTGGTTNWAVGNTPVLTITLDAADAYQFKAALTQGDISIGSPEGVDGTPAVAVVDTTRAGGNATVTITYNALTATKLTTAAVTMPTAPAVGGTAADTGNATVGGGENYEHTSTVWSGAASTDWAIGDTPKATVTLTAKPGYTFADIEAGNITVNNKGEANVAVSGTPGATLVLDITYPKFVGAVTGVTLEGDAQLGEELTAVVAPTGADVTYQWYRDADTAIGSGGNTYTIVKDDIGHTIKVTVTGQNDFEGEKTSAPVTVEKVALTGNVTIEHDDKNGDSAINTGDELTANVSALLSSTTDLAEGDLSFTWKSGGEVVGSDSKTYTITAGDTDGEKTITVTVSIKAASQTYYSGTKESTGVQAGKIALTGIGATTSSDLKVDSILTAGALAPTAATATYKWYRAADASGSGKAEITGQTGTTYTLTAADVGKFIIVEASGTGDFSGTVAAAGLGPVVKKDAPAAPSAATSDVVVDDLTTGKITNVDNTMEYATQADFSDAKDITGTEVTGLDAGTYYVRVKETADTEAGETATVTINNPTPATPNKVTGVAVTAGDKKLDITWEKPRLNGGTFQKYIVDVQDNGVSVAGFPNETMTDADTLTLTVTGLTNGTTYTVTVQAVNETDLAGAVSEPVTGKPVASSKPSGGGGGGGVATQKYTVRYDVGEHGTLKGNKTEDVKKGSYPKNVPSVAAEAGYEFLGWSLDGKKVVDPTTVKITESTKFIALYEGGEGKEEPPVRDDVEIDHYAYIAGMGNGKFEPNGNLTRAQAATMLAQLSEGFAGQSGTTNFTDVTAGDWFHNFIAYAAGEEMVSGYPDNTFKPNGNITRAEFSAMLCRFIGAADETMENTFSDCAGHWAANDIAVLSSKGIVSGYVDGSFKPNQTITRAEAVTMINSAVGRTPVQASVIENLGNYGNPFSDVTPDNWAYYQILESAINHNSEDFH